MFDFGLGSGELLVIAIVALIVIGPKDLPRVLRTLGLYMRKIQGMAREFQNHLNEAAKEAGVDEVKKEVKGMTNFTVTADLDKHGSEIKRAIEGAPKPAIAAPSNGAGAKDQPAKIAPATPTPELSKPIASTEPVAVAKAKDKAKSRPAKQAPDEPLNVAKPRPAAKPKKIDGPREAAKS
jgi:sec-independent protein translocase protein TatB